MVATSVRIRLVFFPYDFAIGIHYHSTSADEVTKMLLNLGDIFRSAVGRLSLIDQVIIPLGTLGTRLPGYLACIRQ